MVFTTEEEILKERMDAKAARVEARMEKKAMNAARRREQEESETPGGG